MTSFPEQLSAVRQTQWETQLELFRRLGSSALDNTEQLIALNIRTSRASLEQAAGTVKKILEASDARDLLAVGSTAHDQWHQMFAYGRELMGIATGMRGSWSTMPSALSFVPALPALPRPPAAATATVPAALRLIPAPLADLPATPSQAAEQLAIASADATTIASDIGAAAFDIGEAVVQSTLDGHADLVPSLDAVTPAAAAAPVEAPAEALAETPAATSAAAEAPAEAADEAADEAVDEPAITPAEAALAFADAASDTAIADAVPPLEVTPLVKALNEVAPKPASVEHPIVSTVPLEAAAGIELPNVEPIEHTAPPPQPALQGKPPRISRKK